MARLERSPVGAAMDAVGASLSQSRDLPRGGWMEYGSTWPEGPVPRIVWEPLSLQYDVEAQLGGTEQAGLPISGYALRIGLHIWAESVDATLLLLHALLRACWGTLGASWRLVSGEWAEAARDAERAAYGRALVVQLELLMPVPRVGAAVVDIETTTHTGTVDVPGGSGPEDGC